MPYSHFHNWSFHTHRRRSRRGNHYRAIKRRQRPWRIGFAVVLAVALVGCSVLAARTWYTPEVETTAGSGQRGLDSLTGQVEPAPEQARMPTAKPTVAAGVAGIALPTATNPPRQTRTRAQTVAELEQKVHAGINSERTKNGGLALRWDAELAAVARAHSDDMVSRKYFDHDTPDGLDPTDRAMRAGYECRKGNYYGIAENIAIETSLESLERTAAEAVIGWVNSPGHRENLLSPEYDRTGVGASYGTWQGYRAVYLTQVFC